MKKQSSGKGCGCGGSCGTTVARRDFLKIAGGGSLAVLAGRLPVMAGPFTREDFAKLVPEDKKLSADWVKSLFERGMPKVYKGDGLKFIGMPVGGICAGHLYLGGDGSLWHWDIFNQHIGTGDGHYANPIVPASPVKQGFALSVTEEGKTESRKLDKQGFPGVSFRGEYPIGTVQYVSDPPFPVSATLEAFSPFIPLSVDDSSLPATVLRFTVKNNTSRMVKALLHGWLENAVCLNHRNEPGTRCNRIVQARGYSFLECSAGKAAPSTVAQRPDIQFEDWNKSAYDGWTVEGTAFGAGPILKSAIPSYQGDVGGDTSRVVNSHASAPTQDLGAKDGATGKLTSREFAVERNFINIWIGGGGHKDRTCVNVLVDGKAVRTATGANNNQMALVALDVREFAGRPARIEIVDAESGSWGNIGVGRITFSDSAASGAPLETLEDYGTMGLALLGGEAEFAAPADGEDGARRGGPAEASAPLAGALVGGLGRELKLSAGESAVVTFVLSWNFPNLKAPGPGRFYATKFPTAQATAEYVAKNIDRLYSQTKLWRDTWYDSTLPYWFLDRTFTNASTLATSTAFRFASGKFWGWEGVGCCAGTCTHVWHYEQTMGRIFPELDIVLRELSELNPQDSLNPDGMVSQRNRGAGPAIDGQAGIILRCLRDHQVSPDDAFLKCNWPKILKALEWLMAQDTDGDGLLDRNQHNTLDAEWYGEIAWLSGLYLAAVRAGEEMAREMGDAAFAAKCRAILEAGRKSFVAKLWNGEYFIQVVDPQHAKTVGSHDGCEIDQVLGQGWAYQVSLGEVLPREQTRTALQSLWKYNFSPDVGPYRKAYPAGRWYAMAGEAGTLMCSWPRGDSKRVAAGCDFYFNECMNGFEHQLAGHMLWENILLEGMAIERAIHDRYDGSRRNPWNEVECGDHYARSMASYGVFLAACGFEYHGPKGHIGFAPRLSPEKFSAAFTAAEGWGTYEQQAKEDGAGGGFLGRITLRHGTLRVKSLSFAVAKPPPSVSVTVGGRKVKSTFHHEGGRLLVTLAEPVVVEAGRSVEVQA